MNKNIFVINGVMFVIVSIFFLKFPLHVDEAVYLYAGGHIRGIYTDVMENKPIGIFLISTLTQLGGKNFIIARLFTYIINAFSTFLIYLIGKKLWDEKAAMISSIVFICGIYIFHGYYFLTEPFTLFFITLCIYLLIIEKNFLAGISIGTASIFNYASFLLLLATILVIKSSRKNILGGFITLQSVLLMLLSYFHLTGNYIYSTFFLTFKWSHPLDILSYAEAFFLFLPIWVICFISIFRELSSPAKNTRRPIILTLKAYLILGIFYMIVSYGGKHIIFFLPSLSLIPLEENFSYRKYFKISILLISIFLLVSSFHLAFYWNGVENQIEETKEIDKYIEGKVYAMPFRLYIPYFSNDTQLGVRWATQAYSGEIAKIVIRDLEERNVTYVIIEKGWDRRYEGRRIIYNYVVENYSIFAETKNYLIYRKLS